MGIYAITGAATGIGAAIKQRLQRDDHELIVVDIAGDDTDVRADLATAAGRKAAVAAIAERAPQGLDGFIACAGVGPQVADKTLIARLNYFGAVQLAEGLGELLAMRRGSLLLISSNSAVMSEENAFVDTLLSGDEAAALDAAAALDGQAIYSASKLALALWMRQQISALAARGIRANAIAPGYIKTPLTAAGEQDPVYGPLIRDFVASTPAGHGGEPEDIAAAAAYLLGDEARFVYGAVLFVDGGHDAMSRPGQF